MPVPPVLAAGVPDPDPSWLPDTLAEWSTFWSSDVANPVVPTDLPALRRLFGMRDLRRQHELAYAASGPFVEGSQGQLVANPLLKLIADLDGRILALEDRFFLVPSARIKSGVAVQNAKSTAELARAAVHNAQAAARATRPDPRLQEAADDDDAASDAG